MFLESVGLGIEKIELSKLQEQKMFGDSITFAALRVSANSWTSFSMRG
jgi:hypothetical protein